MKTRIQFLYFFLTILLPLSLFAQDPNAASYTARLNTFKHECKTLIQPCRYDGSRITHYTAANEKQQKSVEVYFLLAREYKLAFSGKECSNRVAVRIYDSENENNRVLLKEIRNIQFRNAVVSSNELNTNYRKKKNNNNIRLKKVVVEYEIFPTDVNHQAAILVIGYER
ncbi:MAG: hypothetical protein EP338_10255 [Bacteroidetes bacterium]|nr:MAG: hypothetical protein EP338_10255 [Bacteroidota bacterium]